MGIGTMSIKKLYASLNKLSKIVFNNISCRKIFYASFRDPNDESFIDKKEKQKFRQKEEFFDKHGPVASWEHSFGGGRRSKFSDKETFFRHSLIGNITDCNGQIPPFLLIIGKHHF